MPVILRLLGTGSPAPLPERQGSALLLSHGHEHLLFDAGRGVTTQLVRAGVMPQELSAVLLTHHHYDHIGNLGDLLLTAWHGGAKTLPVVGPPGTQTLVGALFEHVYYRELLFSYALANAIGEPMPVIEQVVVGADIDDGGIYRRGRWHISAAAVDHGRQLGLTYAEWPCLAYRVEIGGISVVISGDTIVCESLAQLANGADVLVQCCYLADAAIATPARRLLADTVIATSGQVGKLAARAGVKVLVLTHFAPMTSAMLGVIEADVRRDYAGTLYLGEDLLTIELA